MKPAYYPGLDETVYRETLPNGLTVMVVPRRGFSRRIAYFVADYGSIHTEFTFEGKNYRTPAGVAHYLEHKMFEMPGGWDAGTELAALGASANAFTGYDMTAYYFSCTENFSECLRLLLQFVTTPYFTEETVEKERGIIDQEIDMNRDSPDNRLFEGMMRAAYRNHPIRVPILGTRETIREITPEVLTLCHRAFYAPGNMVLCVVGDVDPEEVSALARAELPLEAQPVAKKKGSWDEPMTCREAFTQCAMEVAMPTFSMAFKCPPPEPGPAGAHREMVAELAAEALFGESSPLYLRLYEEGLIDTAFGGGFETIDGCAVMIISGDSEDPEAIREAVIAQAEKIALEGICREDFLRMKRSAMGRRIRQLDSFDSTCFRLCAYHFTGFDYFAFPDIFQSITAEEIQTFLSQTIRRDRCSLSVITPLT